MSRMTLTVALLIALYLFVGTVEAHAIYPPPPQCEHAEVCIQNDPPRLIGPPPRMGR